MAQTVAIVRNTLTATGAGTTDFTKTGFGTPTAAIIEVIGGSTSTANLLYCDDGTQISFPQLAM